MATVPPPDGGPGDAAGSVSVWIGELKRGDRDAARRLWARYFDRMIRFSRTKLWGSDKLASDEEDVALAAFELFCRGAEAGEFPDLFGRDSLWRLLAQIMGRKAASQVVRERRQKRGGLVGREGEPALGLVEAPGPPPDLAAEMAEEFQRLLDRLPDASLQGIALLKLEGHTNEEVARELRCGVRTVERKLLLIRRHWSEGGP